MKDPVCGMDVPQVADVQFTAAYNGQDFVFCSAQCQQQFLQNPQLYARQSA
jgi:YHS domain-containing protein